MPTFEGDYSTPTGRFAVVAARFNGLITESLLAGCKDTLARHGVADDRVDVAGPVIVDRRETRRFVSLNEVE
jgi:6,7-dimethyl-8-ribityllumazine synthase